jgi:ribonuclease Z
MSVTQLPHCVEACTKWSVGGHMVQGHSISTERTGFYSYTLGVHLDAGMGCYIPVKRLFLTHPHCDHLQHLHMLIHSNPEPPIIYCPEEAKDKLAISIDAFYELADTYHEHKIVGVKAGYEELMTLNDSEYKMKVFECIHTIPTRGYGFSQKRKKIKEEYSSIPGKELGRLRKEGIEISHEVWIPTFAYMCDTSIEAITKEVLSHTVLMVECTFWTSDMEERANSVGHICWTQIKPIIEENPKTQFVLFHISKRYKWTELQAIIDESGLTNVTLWSD